MSKYIVFDLEMCKVPYGEKRKIFGHSTELIQIGAVKLNDSYEIEDTYVTYVHPEFGFVDDYIEKLTGITKQNVINAPSAAKTIQSFFEWVTNDAVLVAWSENDIKQLYAEISGKSIDATSFEGMLENWIDCQQLFGQKMYSERRYKLSEALNMCAIDYEDGEHDGLVDAKNTAALFKKIQTEDELQLSPYLVVGSEDDCQSGYLRGNLISA